MHTTAIRQCIARQTEASPALASEALAECQALEAILPATNRRERIAALQAMITRLETELTAAIDWEDV